jgi:hypothetical protein
MPGAALRAITTAGLGRPGPWSDESTERGAARVRHMGNHRPDVSHSAAPSLGGVSMADYRVHRGETLLGSLTRTGHDMPWWDGIFDLAPYRRGRTSGAVAILVGPAGAYLSARAVAV